MIKGCAISNHAVQVVPFRSRGGLERQPRRCHSFAVRCNVKIEKPGASGYAVEGNRPTSPKVSDFGYYCWILGDLFYSYLLQGIIPPPNYSAFQSETFEVYWVISGMANNEYHVEEQGREIRIATRGWVCTTERCYGGRHKTSRRIYQV